jgi:hypothetical protein
MGEATQVAIDEGTHQDLRWFIACAHAVNGSVTIFKCLRPRLDIFVSASLQGLVGALGSMVYRHALPARPDVYKIFHIEINIRDKIHRF